MRTVSNLEFVFATFTFPKMHLVCHPKFCISIVFNFSWDGCNTQEKSKTASGYAKFGGQTRCIRGDVSLATSLVLRRSLLKSLGLIDVEGLVWTAHSSISSPEPLGVNL